MTRNPIRRLVLLFLLLPLPAIRAEEPALRDLLRDALYTEEVTRDPEQAAKQYEDLLSRHDAQKTFAAAALFRLAEVRRKQDRKEDAIKLYQRLIAEFPGAETETKLARENLVTLGGKMPEAAQPAEDEETKELARLHGLAKTAPDLFKRPENLERAVGNGWVKCVQFLLDSGVPPFSPNILVEAASEGRLDVCRVLLKHGGIPPREMVADSLSEAVGNGYVEVARELLAHALPQDSGDKIHVVSQALPWLIAGDMPFDRDLAMLLMNHGANSNRGEPVSAFEKAIVSGDWDAANFFLDHGADAKSVNPKTGFTPLHHLANRVANDDSIAICRRLLEAGADPNARTGLSNDSTINSTTPLHLAIRNQNTSVVALMLDHQADPNLLSANGESPLQIANNSQGALGLFRLLVDHGAVPPKEWIRDGFSGNYFRGNESGETRAHLIRRFLFPEWLAGNAIRLVYPEKGNVVLLAEKSGEDPPPLLARLLLDQDGKAANGPPNRIARLVIHRLSSDPVPETIRFDISAAEPYPALKWGDVVEIEMDDKTYSGVLGYGWHSETGWALRRHLSFPVNIETPGTSRKIMIRGDRLTYDPSKDEAPWLGAGALMTLIWNPPHNIDRAGDYAVVVRRSGWPDIRLAFGDPNTDRFPIQPEDTLVLQLPSDHENRMKVSRSSGVSLHVVGLAQARTFGRRGMVVLPTLFQAIMETYAPWREDSFEKEYDREPSRVARKLAWGSLATPVDLPYPDFSQIRLRRLDEAGKETTTVINLERIIKESGGTMTSAEARRHDVNLQAGDIVELSLKTNHPKQAWTGFSKEEVRFFGLALACRFKVIDGKGNLLLQELHWAQPDWQRSEGGLLPFPPPVGNASARASRLNSNNFNLDQQPIRLVRDGKRYERLSLDDIFVKDGDEISSSLVSSPDR